MMPPGLRNFGLVVAGLLMGVVGIALGLWVYLQAARIEGVRTQVAQHLQGTAESIERIEVIEHDALRFTVRDIALLDEAGQVILEAPRVLMTLDVPSLNSNGAIEFYDVELIDPDANLVQNPAGDWNFMQVASMTAGGEPVESNDGRPIRLRGITVSDGNAVIAMPAPPEGVEPEGGLQIRLPTVQIGGVTYRRYSLSDVNADLPEIRFGGDEAWRVDIASLTGLVREPDLGLVRIAGSAEQEGESGLRFELATLAVGDSRLAGQGAVRFTDAGPLFDLTLRAAPLLTADLRAVLPGLPEDGFASFALDVQSVTAARHGLIFRDLDLALAESRILGDVGIAIGGDVPPALLAAALEVNPLDLAILEQLGLVEEIPVLGGIRGRITSSGADAGFATVDLEGLIVPRDEPGAEPSTIRATGRLAIGNPEESFQLDGLVVGFEPLRLATLRGMVAPEQAERLRGEVRGSVALAGTVTDLLIADGDLSYDAGDGTETTLTGLTGRVTMDPLSYTVRAQASPLALSTLTALFPGLPFRNETLSGPIEISGTEAGFDVVSDLAGASGGIEFTASVNLGDVPTFDVSGSLRAFAAGMVLSSSVPLEGPLTGTFLVRGSTQYFTFDVDFEQADGTFALIGTANMGADPARFDVAGNVVNFRIGSLLGNPTLFPEPMTGPISISGGGGDPYAFNIDLQGATGLLDVSGVFRPGTVPSYEIQGNIVALDLGALPSPRRLPPTALTGRIDVAGSGTNLETLAGSYSFDLTNSTVSNLALDAALGRIVVANGVARVDTLHVQLESTVLVAAGSWGLQSPAAEPLRFGFSSPDLSELSRVIAPNELIPPQLAGSLRASGEVGGSVEYPVIRGSLTGRRLRYEDWRAATLDVTMDVARSAGIGWAGQLALSGDELFLPRIEGVETVRLEASGNESSLAVGMFGRRDDNSDIAFSGLLEMAGLRPQGIALQTMTLRAQGVAWNLLSPSRVRYVADEGLLIENLVLQRNGPGAQGRITLNGMLPPTGDADLEVLAENVDLADFNRISPVVPAMTGLLSMNAVLNGPVVDPLMSVDATISQFGYEGVVTERVDLSASYMDGALSGAARAYTGGSNLFEITAEVPTRLSMENRLIPAFELDEGAPLNAILRADSLPLDVAASLFPGVSEGAGLARANVVINGTIEAPTMQGWIRIDNGALTVEMSRTRYTGIHADIDLANNQATINDLTIASGGTLTATGAIGFPTASTPSLDITVRMNGFRLMNDPELAELTTTGELFVSGPVTEPVLRGQVNVYESTLQVPEMGQGQPELGIAYADIGQLAPAPEGEVLVAAPIVGNIRIDGVNLTFGESVWLESDDMRVQIEGSLIVYRLGEEFRVYGDLLALRGTYNLQVSGIVREFDVIQGRVQFYGTGELDPSLDIVAGYRVRSSAIGEGGDITILVSLTGTLLAPRVQLTSDTPVQLSEADLISYLMFGQPSFELGGVGVQFAQQVFVQEFVGGILATGIEETILRSGLCDWFRVRPGVTSNFRGLIAGGAFTNAGVECGRELAPSLYLTAQANLGGFVGQQDFTGQLGLEWQIDNQWSVEAAYGALQRDAIARIFDARVPTQFSMDLRRQWEYGRPTRRSILDIQPDTTMAGAPPPTPPEALPGAVDIPVQ